MWGKDRQRRDPEEPINTLSVISKCLTLSSLISCEFPFSRVPCFYPAMIPLGSQLLSGVLALPSDTGATIHATYMLAHTCIWL